MFVSPRLVPRLARTLIPELFIQSAAVGLVFSLLTIRSAMGVLGPGGNVLIWFRISVKCLELKHPLTSGVVEMRLPPASMVSRIFVVCKWLSTLTALVQGVARLLPRLLQQVSNLVSARLNTWLLFVHLVGTKCLISPSTLPFIPQWHLLMVNAG